MLTKTQIDLQQQEIIITKICEALKPLRLVEKYRAGHPEDIVTAVRQRIEALRREFDSNSPAGNIKKINRAARVFRKRFLNFKIPKGQNEKFIDLLRQTFPGHDVEGHNGARINIIDSMLQWYEEAPGRNATFDEAAFNDALIAYILIKDLSQEPPSSGKGSLHTVTAYVQELRTGVEPKVTTKTNPLRRAVDAVVEYREVWQAAYEKSMI
jgi:hypothetical protein